MARAAALIVLLSLVCSCALASPSYYVYTSNEPTGTEVPYLPINPYNTNLFLQSANITLLNSTNYIITSQYYIYQTQPTPFKGAMSPVIFSGLYAITGLVQPSGIFFSVPNPTVCQQAPTTGTTVNLCSNGYAVPYYANSWAIQAVNVANSSVAMAMGAESRLFAGLPEASAFYCSGPCPAITVPGLVTALLSLVRSRLALINLF